MRNNVLLLLAVVFVLPFTGMPVLAHHSFMAEFDMSKPITLKGVVTKIDYVNPHISFFIDVTDTTGKVTNWVFEGAGPSALSRRGWIKNTMKPGDSVTVDGFPAKNGRPIGAARTVAWADGRQLYAGSDGVAPSR